MLRLLEHYVSMQGECDNTGLPTQFVRFAGCNLRCEGWKCDTPFAIYPKLFMKEQKLVSVDGLASMIEESADETGARNVCFTGGEPLLQPKVDLDNLILELKDVGYYTFEMFSNGTLEYPGVMMRHCSIRMDWKLPGSGEDPNNPMRIQNYDALAEWGHHTIKFTIKDTADFERALDIYDKYDMANWPGSIYAGPVWDQEFTAKDVADGILTYKLPWKLNIQSHNYVYGAHMRRT
jgi:7-carboxy-7-deazaguanine synthase